MLFLISAHCREDLTLRDVDDISLVYSQLQEFTHNLCRGSTSLPVLAVELQNSCHLLQVTSADISLCGLCCCQDAKVVTIFNMIAVPCFVYQGAVGLIGDIIYQVHQ